MKYFKMTLALLAILTIASCSRLESKENLTQRWVKGNLHTHSYWSDGDEFPEVILDWYKSNDYQFIALSDHNIIAQGEKWKMIPEDSIYQKAFSNYLDYYGSDWASYKTDSLGNILVKLKTYEEYKGRFEEDNKFLVIKAEEITDRFENKHVHVNATNVQEKIDPQGGNTVLEVLQRNINAVIEQREKTGIPMIPHINHPNFHYSVSLEDMIALRGERFFEIYNGHPMVHNLGDSVHLSTEEMWDLINISYLENDQPLMYGLATDDSHNYHVRSSELSNAGRGWIMVESDSLSAASLIASMEAGEFYASSGVTLKGLAFDKNILTVEIDQEAGITYTLSFIGCRVGETAPETFQSVEGFQASFELPDDILFVRCKITSSNLHSNPIETLLYEMAWTQPVLRNN